MNRIKCLIVDDEPPAVSLIEQHASMIDLLEVVATCHSAVKAFELIKENDIDLMFLDIQMPVLNGVDFLKSLSHPPAVIFTTAYRDYAIEGFDLDVVDYLLKPIEFSRFVKAVDRFQERFQDRHRPLSDLSTDEYILFNINKTQHKVRLSDIRYVESLKDYSRVFTADGNYVVKGNIGSLMSRLPDHLFIRIHRSFAVAIQYVTSFNKAEVMIGEKRLPLGVSYRDEFMKKW